MDNNMSRVVIVILGVAVIIVAIFAFNQTNSLNETATELANVEDAGTQFAEESAGTATQGAVNLADANDSGTQSAEEADATGTQGAVELAEANDSGTQSAVDLAEANDSGTQSAEDAADVQSNLEATGTQVASDFSDVSADATSGAETLADVEAEATESAEILVDLEVDATSGAETLANVEADATIYADNAIATATQQANDLADALATVASITGDLTSSEEMVSTLEADLESANETINAQATTIAGIDKEDSNDDDDDDDNGSTDANVEDGFVLFEAEDFTIMMPDDFLVFDLRTDQEDAIDTFDDLGGIYAGMEGLARQGTSSGIVLGARDTPNEGFTVDNFLVLEEELPFSVGMQLYLESAVSLLPDNLTPLEQGIIEINGDDVGYVVLENDVNGLTVNQLVYIYNVDDSMYLLFYTTTEDLFEERRPVFEASLQSFIAND